MAAKKLGLALGSGGSRGFCHVGVLEAFEKHDIKIDYITGCSMGSLVGGCYCAGVSVDEMKKVAAKISQLTVLDVSISNRNMGVLRGKRSIQLVKKLIGDKQFSECNVPIKMTAADIISGEQVILDNGSLVDAMRASMSIPGLFHAVKDEDHDRILIDGGIIERIPINLCRDMGADVVIAVDALGALCGGFSRRGIVSVIERAYLMLDWQSTCDKIKSADMVITPDMGDKSIVEFKDNEYQIEQGRLKTEEMMNDIKSLIGM